MPERNIYLKPTNNPSSIIEINCGTSGPQLGGTIDVSQFPNLTSFKCDNNHITGITGISGLNSLTTLSFMGNRITGSIPSLPPNLINFDCSNTTSEPRTMTGSIPTLPSSIQRFACNNHNISGPIPPLPTGLVNFFAIINNLTGSIPNLSGYTKLANFRCENNLLSGPFPTLPANIRNFDCSANRGITGSLPNLSQCPQLSRFACSITSVSGNIPNLGSNNSLQYFYGARTQLSGFSAENAVTNKLGVFNMNDAKLTTSAVDAILAAFVAAGRTRDNATTITQNFPDVVLNLAGTGNAIPTSGFSNVNYLTLVSRGWSVTISPQS